MKKTITAPAGQTIFDAAIKHYGDIAGISQIIADNEDINTRPVIEHTELKIDINAIENIPVVNYFNGRNQQIVSY